MLLNHCVALGEALIFCFYYASTNPSSEYGCQFLPINHPSKIDKFEKIQRKTVKICLGLRSSNVVLAESCIPPLKLRFAILSERYILKSFTSDSNPIIDALYDLQYTLLNKNTRKFSINFPLYHAFLKLKKFKSKVSSFDGAPEK